MSKFEMWLDDNIDELYNKPGLRALIMKAYPKGEQKDIDFLIQRKSD